MTDPIDDLAAIDKVVALVADESVRFLAELDASPALPAGAAEAAERFGGPLPEQGEGARRRRSPSCCATACPRPSARRARGCSTS